MYERFTDRSRKVMQLANQEAQRLGHEYIATEHILIGLAKEGSGIACNVLTNLGCDADAIRLAVEKLVQRGPELTSAGKVPKTPRAKRVIEYAIEEATALRHNYVGTEHILLGLMREEEGTAYVVLKNFGLTGDKVRDGVMNLLGMGPKEPLPPIDAKMAALIVVLEKTVAEMRALIGERVTWTANVQVPIETKVE